MPRMAMHCTWFFLSPMQPFLKELSREELENAFTFGMELFLARFPAAAGRTKHEPSSGRWYLEYNDQGADLEVVQSDQPLGDGWKGFDGKFDPAFAPRPVLIVDDNSTLFAVKLTRFSCGSLTLSTSTHHWLVDFVGYVDLVEQFGQCVSLFLSEEANAFRSQANIRFDWSRDLLKYANQVNPDPIPTDIWFNERGQPPQMTRAPSSCRYASLLFTPSSLEKLKGTLAEWALTDSLQGESAGVLPSKENWIGTNDALHALLWAAITDARSLESDAVTGLHLPLDGRRLLPSLAKPDEANGKYIGNVHSGHVFPLPASRVSSKDRSSLFHLAWLIRTQYLSLTPGQMSSIIRYHNYAESSSFGPGRLPRNTSMFGNDVTISNISRLPVRERVHFGDKIGRPYTHTVIGMVPVTLNGLTLDSADGTCFILKAPGEWTSYEAAKRHQPIAGQEEKEPGVVAYVGMRCEEMQALLKNPLIQQFAVVL